MNDAYEWYECHDGRDGEGRKENGPKDILLLLNYTDLVRATRMAQQASGARDDFRLFGWQTHPS